MASKGKVRRHLLQFGAFLLLLVCLCAQVAETFDFWDHTLQTGNDIEYSLVIVVLIVGALRHQVLGERGVLGTLR
jgi:hypothetical protein